MSDNFKTILISVLGTCVVVLVGLVIYQRVVIDKQMHLVVDMYRFISMGCPLSQLH